MPLQIIRNDITKMPVDAIVNAANNQLRQGGGVCGAIFAAAGPGKLQAACDRLAPCPTGSAVITPGFGLPAKHVIHAVGPVWQGGQQGEKRLLRSAYESALKLATEHGLKSIAFPLISSGVYGYPKDEALRVAMDALSAYVMHHNLLVYLVVFDRTAFKLSDRLAQDLQSFIDDNYVDEMQVLYGRRRRITEQLESDAAYSESRVSERPAPHREAAPMPYSAAPGQTLEEMLKNQRKSFSEHLLQLISKSGMTDPQVYNRANLDRKHFNKICNNPKYNPKKSTVIALAVALGLNLPETRDLLERAGYSLSRSSRADVIVEYHLLQGNCTVSDLNMALFSYDEPTIGTME